MTAYVWRATHLERATRWRQTLLIWLVPVFGLLVMYAIRGSISATWKGYRGSGSDDHFCGPQGQR